MAEQADEIQAAMLAALNEIFDITIDGARLPPNSRSKIRNIAREAILKATRAKGDAPV